MNDHKLLVCAVASIVAHFALARGLQRLPRHVDQALPQKIDIRVIPPDPEPEPPKPPEPKPPEPKPDVHERPAARPVNAPQVEALPKDTPPPDHPAFSVDTTETPVFGVTMESTSQAGGGPVVPTGNTMKPTANVGSGAAKPLAEPVAAFEATKMPLPQGQCFGKYTDDARAAGVEGTVVLDVIVGEDGSVRDVKVVEGLTHGLTEAAIAALHACRFSPGEKDGKAVPVRIRGFKIHFVLQEAN